MTYEERKELFLNNLKEKKNNEFELLGEFTKVRDKTKFKHKKCGYEWETIPHTLMESKGTGCPNCQYRAKSKTTEEYKDELKDATKGEYTLVKGQKYYNNRSKLKFIHTTCGTEFFLTPTSIFTNDTSCPSCLKKNRKTRKKTTEIFNEELYVKHEGEYVLDDSSEYKSALDKVTIIHVACGHKWDVRASHILHTSKCPKCNTSKGEELIQKELNNLNVKYVAEYTLPDLKNTRPLPFDFGILDNGELVGLIEYDGSQHFQSFKHFGGDAKLKKTQYNDKKKDKYCLDNKIPLRRIKYTLTESEVKQETINFINEIIQK